MNKIVIGFYVSLFLLTGQHSFGRLLPGNYASVKIEKLKTWPLKQRVAYLKLLGEFLARVESKQSSKLYVDGHEFDTEMIAQLFLNEAQAASDPVLGQDCMNALNLLTMVDRADKPGHAACLGGVDGLSCAGSTPSKPLIQCNPLFNPEGAPPLCVLRSNQGGSRSCLAKFEADKSLLERVAQEVIKPGSKKAIALADFQTKVDKFKVNGH